jgi:hypothetical protein
MRPATARVDEVDPNRFLVSSAASFGHDAPVHLISRPLARRAN